MNIVIEIPDKINQKLTKVSNPNAFIVDAIKKALEMQIDTKDSEYTEIAKEDESLIKNSVKKHKKVLLKLAK